MTEIRPLPEGDYEAFTTLVANAYPAMQIDTPEGRERFWQRIAQTQAEDPIATAYGAYRAGRLVGGMMLYDFTMQMRSARTLAGGVGMVAVDLLHKKEKVARDMIAFFLAHYDQKQAPIALLYPFRPDFYRQMGFGYGTQKYQYRVRPTALPRGASKAHLRTLGLADKEAVRNCYNRLMARSSGLIEKSERELEQRMLGNPQLITLGHEEGGVLQGYMVLSFKRAAAENPFRNDLVVHELVYHTPEALAEMLTFLHTQKDQVEAIVFNTQDEHFYHLLLDPRNGSEALIPHVYHPSSVAGVGLMYRVINVRRAFEVLGGHDFGGQTCTVQITLRDSFYAANAGSTVVHFMGGRPTVVPEGEAEVAITLDVAEFSSLLMGVIPFRRLHQYGLAEVSDPAYLDLVDGLFQAAEKPMCMTGF